jgi:ABC-type polysaccharide/polyol phosphate export permease
MVAYFKAIWSCRYFWLSLVKIDLRTRYRGSILGMGWSLLHPIAMTIVICVAFSFLLGTPKPIEQFAPYLMAGLTFWSFLSTVTVGGCQSFFAGESYIRQYPAPMAIYPLRTMLGGAFHYSLGLALVIVLGGIMHGYTGPLPLLSLIPTFILLLALGWTLAIVFAVINVRFRDTNHLSEVGLQILFYATPVIYDTKQILHRNPNMAWFFALNPLVPFLDLLHKPLEGSEVPDLTTYLAAAAIVAVSSATAALVLRSQERKVIFHL